MENNIFSYICLNYFLILIFSILLIGCHSYYVKSDAQSKVLNETWNNSKEWPPEEMEPPPGFNISPANAFKIVAESKKLSLKHQWICFNDTSFYYIVDTFGKLSLNYKTIKRNAVKINGRTGKIE
jgi:hypothetical protein